MLSHDIETRSFAAMRVWQIARLLAIQRQHGDEFNEFGHVLTHRAIVTMVMDCREAGVSRAVMDAIFAGAE